MNGRTLAFVLAILATRAVVPGVAAGETATTPIQSQSIPMTFVSGGPGMSGLGAPLSFNQFDSSLGTLDGVAVTFAATIRSDFLLGFAATPIPTTLYVATTMAADPRVLADPTLAAQLTDGPSIALGGPGGATIFGGAGTTLPVDVVSMAAPSGTYSSMLAITDPHYIPPDDVTLSLARAINASNDPALLAQFIGTGSVDLPVTAVAHSSFFSDSGNGGAAVITKADATVTVQYFYTPAAGTPTVPEPSGLVLLALGAGMGLTLVTAAQRAGASPPARP